MRVLLTDGSGLTARQAATQLGAAGHHVEALSSDPLPLVRFTHHVRKVHRVPPYGPAPLAWLDVALARYRARSIDVLLPTQEQVAVLACESDRLRAVGVATAVPSFAAVEAVQDKCSAHRTLDRLGLPQPDGMVADTASELMTWNRFPAFVKTPIGTASVGVRRVRDRAELTDVAALFDSVGTFAAGGVLVQLGVAGDLTMVQSVFERGELVAFHANRRVREGSGGGASHKASIVLPDVREHVGVLGRALNWHGALSLDVMLASSGALIIDVNPRLVEPGNAWRSGVDLVGPMLDIARDRPASRQPASDAGVRTHQLLLAILGAAEHECRRRAVVRELLDATRRRSWYERSVEELTPAIGDPRALVPVIAATAATIVTPNAWRAFVSGAVSHYALDDGGWRSLVERAAGRP